MRAAVQALDEVFQGIDRNAVNRILTSTAADASAAYATPLGNSGFQTPAEFAQAVLQRYQQYIDEAYAALEPMVRNGTLRPPSGISRNTYLGRLVDRRARDRLREWLAFEEIAEGPLTIQVNRRLHDVVGSGAYRIPDIRIPGARVIIDGSLELKSTSTAQVIDFNAFSGGDGIIIVRPTQIGGAYGLVFP